MRWTVVLVVSSAFLGLSAINSPATADDATAEPEKLISVGAGLIGMVGGNFLNKPDTDSPTYKGHLVSLSTYPGFGGVSRGGGLMLEGRFRFGLGLELDVLRSSDHGHGDLTINGTKFTIDVGQSAWHLPVLLKFVAPLPVVRPMVFLGPEFVFPGSPDASVDPQNPNFWTVKATASSYTLFTWGVGMEFKLPLDGVDLRIPFTLRGSVNTGLGNKLDDRATHGITPVGSAVKIDEVTYKSEWKYQAQATLGVAAYF